MRGSVMSVTGKGMVRSSCAGGLLERGLMPFIEFVFWSMNRGVVMFSPFPLASCGAFAGFSWVILFLFNCPFAPFHLYKLFHYSPLVRDYLKTHFDKTKPLYILYSSYWTEKRCMFEAHNFSHNIHRPSLRYYCCRFE